MVVGQDGESPFPLANFFSTGIERVWVSGEMVYDEGQTTGRFPGEVIRRE